MYFLKRKRTNSAKPTGPISWLPTRKTLILWAVVLLVGSIILNLALLKRHRFDRTTIIEQKKVLSRVEEPLDAASEISGHWYGLCSRDVIRSIEDFHKTVGRDPLLAAHFADFDWENARLGRLENAIWAHVTYRKNEKIQTTRRVIRLPEGDGYITDGKRWVRTYCCNDYVLAGSGEQHREKIDTDEDRLINRTDKYFDLKSMTEREATALNDVIPEPATFLLLITGIAGLGLVRFARKRR